MATYSTYDYDSRTYTYWSAPGPAGTHAGAPPAPSFRSAIGAVPEAAAWKLPWGAKKVGTGMFPKGRIATSSAALGDLTADLPRLGLFVGAAYIAWRLLR